MSSDMPGIVSMKEYSDSEEVSVNILKRGVHDFGTLPPVIVPTGLDPARQWYLYDEIRPFCKDTSDNLQSCPKPSCPKPKVKYDNLKHKRAEKEM